jgi:hypothetical protein
MRLKKGTGEGNFSMAGSLALKRLQGRSDRLMRRLLLAIAATVSLMLLPQCSSTTASEDGGDEITRANYLIEQKQYSEAIFILDDRIKKQPADTRARVLIASAYAGRAGIKLSSYSDFAAELSKWGQVDELLSPDDDGSLLQTVGKAALRIQLILKAFDALPTASGPEGLNDIKAGLSALDQAAEIHGGPAIYRALLRVAVFKQSLHTVYKPNFLAGCRISPPELAKWFSTVGGDIEKIVNDVSAGVADPETKKRTLEFGGRLQSAIDEVEGATAPFGFTVEFPASIKKVYGKCD